MGSSREPDWDACFKDAMEASESEQPEGTEEERSKNDGMGQYPSFSLAGSGAQNPNNNRGYTGEEYGKYDSQADKGDDCPTWSLTQPLPHIVRPGTRHGALSEDRREDKGAMTESDEDPMQTDEGKSE
ncbi:hypothetical protein VN97_g10172 [Penicillium thymicola]|uniref:Uncharacterized protein n=1 Tax=Penicillium thymicola TaxID=293382 RepID=A0AAI9T9I4_PENTH|nr:hypothetical protein VN97_g10172 [Penicillium thymicola]